MKTSSAGRWLVVHIAHNRQQADAVVRMLEEEGFLVNVKALGGMVSASGACELRVLASEAEEARRLLLEKGL